MMGGGSDTPKHSRRQRDNVHAPEQPGRVPAVQSVLEILMGQERREGKVGDGRVVRDRSRGSVSWERRDVNRQSDRSLATAGKYLSIIRTAAVYNVKKIRSFASDGASLKRSLAQMHLVSHQGRWIVVPWPTEEHAPLGAAGVVP